MKKNEDILQDKKLNEIISKAILKCKKNNTKNGIPNTFIKNNKIFFEMLDGKITDINPFDK